MVAWIHIIFFLCFLNKMAVILAPKLAKIFRKCYKTLGNNDAVLKFFYAFILPCFKYCSLVWCSVSDSHLKLLKRAPNNIRFFLMDFFINLEKRSHITCLSMLYKFYITLIIHFIENSHNLQD